MFWCAIICLLIGAIVGYLKREHVNKLPVMEPYSLPELQTLCCENGSYTTHVWAVDQFGVFPSLVGYVANGLGKGAHLEAVYSLEESVYYKDVDYGKLWLAFPTKEAAEAYDVTTLCPSV